MHTLRITSTPKHVKVDVLKHYCNSNEVCALVGLHCTNYTINACHM